VFVLGDTTILSPFLSVFTSELANYVHSPISPLAGGNKGKEEGKARSARVAIQAQLRLDPRQI